MVRSYQILPLKYKIVLLITDKVCIRFGVVGPLFIYKMVKSTTEFLTREEIEISGQEFYGVVDHFVDKKRNNNTKFDTNLTVQ